MSQGDKTAVILFNLGGPSSPEAIKPFLYNLFADPAIIQLPTPFRQILAWFIAKKRDPIARKIYDEIGGKSPILKETEKQQQALDKILKKQGQFKTFIAMRYWHPFARDVVKDVEKYQPKKIILLPLYPQFSTTTTASSFKNWSRAVKKIHLNVPTVSCCCYGEDDDFVCAHVENIKQFVLSNKNKAPIKKGSVRVLFSAHGLPQKIVDAGDPYPRQMERSVDKIVTKLETSLGVEKLDYKLCYQSRVGPLKWLSPSLDDEIKKAAVDNVGVLIVPVSFVSEHSETLVELDIEYKKLANQLGVPSYERVPTLSINKQFIKSLASLVLKMNNSNASIICNNDNCFNIK